MSPGPHLNKLAKFSLIGILCTVAQPAFAYLDPGITGALFGAISALAGSAIFFAKDIYYSIVKRGRRSQDSFSSSPILFSEGTNYWSTFEPVIDELIRREIKFRYVTFDLYDPALEIDDKFMESRLYSPGLVGLVKFSMLQTPVMLSTTPNIGAPGYSVKRPRGVSNLIHVFHSVCDIAFYKSGSLDHYDEVLLAGSFQENGIREIEQKRKLPQKELTIAGLPYIDHFLRKLSPTPKINEGVTILVGSSWGEKGCLKVYGMSFVLDLANSGFSVIVRPHPQSMAVEPEQVADWQRKLAEYPNVSWDFDSSPVEAMSCADILIADLSSLRLDFALLYQKPVITLHIDAENYASFEAAELDYIWDIEISPRLGPVIDETNIAHLSATVEDLLKNHRSETLVHLRNELLPYIGESGSRIVDHLETQIARTTND